MLRFALRRALRALAALAAFQSLLFLLIQAVPGDYASTATRTSSSLGLRAALGLNLPAWRQYAAWLMDFLHGDLGRSFDVPHARVSSILLGLAPWTLLLFLPASALGFALGAWLGARLAWRRGGRLDAGGWLGGTALAVSFPPWLAFLLVNVFAFRLRWTPAEGAFDRVLWVGMPMAPARLAGWMLATAAALAAILFAVWWATRRAGRRALPVRLGAGVFAIGSAGLAWSALGLAPLGLDILRHLALPLIALTALSCGETMLLMRAAMRAAMDEDHVWAARARGLSEAQLRDRHVAPLAMPAVLARFLLHLPFVLIGSLLLERFFQWRGIGQALLTAADRQDVPVLMGWLSVVAIAFLIAHVVMDVLVAWMDPRLRGVTMGAPPLRSHRPSP